MQEVNTNALSNSFSTETSNSLVRLLGNQVSGVRQYLVVLLCVLFPPPAASRSFRVAPLLTFIRFAGIASGHDPIPAGMMSPSPLFSYGAIGHRVQGAGLMRCAFINVNDKASQH